MKKKNRHQHSLRLCLLPLEALRLSPWPMELRKTTASATSPKRIVPAAQSRWVPPAGRQITAEGAPFTLWQVERSLLQPVAEPLAWGLCRCKSEHLCRTNHSTQHDEDEKDEVWVQRAGVRWDLVDNANCPSTHEALGETERRGKLVAGACQEILTWVSNPAQEHVSY